MGRYTVGDPFVHPAIQDALYRIAVELAKGDFSQDPIESSRLKAEINTALQSAIFKERDVAVSRSINGSICR
jgi:hypothetical protein